MTALQFENIAYVALGSNLGDRLSFLKTAVEMLDDCRQCYVLDASAVYETTPYGNKNQNNFYNAAIKISTNFGVLELLDYVKKVEKDLGRIESYKWGPRKIDLDILFYNNLIYSNERLTLPHKEIPYRDFVLIPLCEIAPEFTHPALNLKICDICILDLEKNIIKKLPDKIFNKKRAAN